MEYKIIVKDEYLNKINMAAYEIEKEGFWISKINYDLGEIIGKTECPSRFTSSQFVESINEIIKEKVLV